MHHLNRHLSLLSTINYPPSGNIAFFHTIQIQLCLSHIVDHQTRIITWCIYAFDYRYKFICITSIEISLGSFSLPPNKGGGVSHSRYPARTQSGNTHTLVSNQTSTKIIARFSYSFTGLPTQIYMLHFNRNRSLRIFSPRHHQGVSFHYTA